MSIIELEMIWWISIFLQYYFILNNVGMNRRNFLKTWGSFVTGLFAWLPVWASAETRAKPDDTTNKKLIHRNTASLARVHPKVLEFQNELLQMLNADNNDPVDAQFGSLIKQWEVAKEYFAKLLSVSTDEFVFTPNTTESINMIANGLVPHLLSLRQDWKKPTILTTNLEHSGWLKWRMHIEKQFQIPLVKIELSPSPTPDQVLSALQQKIEENPDVSVISLSHTTYQTGTVLPIKAIRQLLNTMWRSDSILVVDGAQAWLDVNISELGCDAYATSGHKWFWWPASSGVLYIKKSAQTYIKPSSLQDGYGIYSWATGTPDITSVLVLQKAVEMMLEGRGQSVMRNQILEKRYALYEALEDLGMQMLSPENSALQRSGIVSFAVSPTTDHGNLFGKLKEKNHITKVIPGWIRLSVGPDISDKNIELFASDLAEILGK